jgi:hypothetical protein
MTWPTSKVCTTFKCDVFYPVWFLSGVPAGGVWITPKRVGPDKFLSELLTSLCVTKLVVNKYFSNAKRLQEIYNKFSKNPGGPQNSGRQKGNMKKVPH